MEKPDFRSGWDSLLSAINSAAPGLLTAAAVLGVALVIIAGITYLWNKRRGGSATQGSGALIWVAIIGGVLAGPTILVPLILDLAALIVGLVVAIWRAVFPG